MKKMEAIHLNNARNGEHYQFHADVLALLDEATAAAAGFSALRREYAGRFAREEVLYGRNRGYECTPEIVRKDEERDRLFLYLKQTVDTRRTAPDPSEREAAGRLAFLLEPYRDSHRRPASENTAMVTSLTDELRGPEYGEAVARLGLTETAEALRRANEEFNGLYAERAAEKLERRSRGTLKRARAEVDKTYLRIARLLDALYLVNAEITRSPETEAELGRLVDGVNALVLQLRETMGRRRAYSHSMVEGGLEEMS